MDEAVKLTAEASTWRDHDLAQNLETQEIPAKTVLNLHKGPLHYTEEEMGKTGRS